MYEEYTWLLHCISHLIFEFALCDAFARSPSSKGHPILVVVEKENKGFQAGFHSQPTPSYGMV